MKKVILALLVLVSTQAHAYVVIGPNGTTYNVVETALPMGSTYSVSGSNGFGQPVNFQTTIIDPQHQVTPSPFPENPMMQNVANPVNFGW